ncbi:MAG: hypothetical protein ISR45_09820 [Rhodospirillales bacterium]|nr:hypothetical protein [Rhodospirillales bacterium]
MSVGKVISKEMGITHQEFFRNIPRALGTDEYVKNEDGVIVDDGSRRLEIAISEQGERRIALFTLPVTHVTLTFRGYTEKGVAETMAAFDLAFQRGGG